MNPPLHLLDDKLLVSAHRKAIALQLDKSFITLLEIEIQKRNLKKSLLQEV